jgi:hypothetical protein
MTHSARLGIGAVLVLMAVVFSAFTASADIPRKINYQGLLTDSDDGEPLVGTYDLTFRIYDASSGGDLLWSEMGSVTTDKFGVFSALIGSSVPLDISFEGPCWLEIVVEGETLGPRRELASVPYAFRAINADSLGGLSSASFSLVGHTHDEYITQGEVAAVTAEMIAGGQIDDSHVAHDAGIDPSKTAGHAWTAGNDGAGSGLDADMLGGLDADAFSDSGHVHDNRYYRQTELYLPGSINEVSNPVCRQRRQRGYWNQNPWCPARDSIPRSGRDDTQRSGLTIRRSHQSQDRRESRLAHTHTFRR